MLNFYKLKNKVVSIIHNLNKMIQLIKQYRFHTSPNKITKGKTKMQVSNLDSTNKSETELHVMNRTVKAPVVTKSPNTE